jgi:hypothetical protein
MEIDRKRRAKLFREQQRATKAWDSEARAAVAGTIWRLGSVWIEEATNTPCAEFINASTGKTHAVRLTSPIPSTDRKTEVQRLLSITR